MLFSIIVPVYNVEKYIDECINSLLSQDFSDFEIVLVDDGSTDLCPQICDDYAKKYSNITVVHQKNMGLSEARNTGIRNSKGSYICFLDSDDFWSSHEDMKKIADAAITSPDIIRYEKKRFFEGEDEYIDNEPVDFSVFQNLSPDRTLLELMSSDQLKEAATLLALKREYVLKNDLFFKSGIKSEDIEWAFRLYRNEPTWGFVPDRIYVYRIGREGSITTTIGYKHLLDCCNTIDSSLAIVKLCTGETKKALMAFLMYNTVITCAHISNSTISRVQKKELFGRLKPICASYLLDNILGKKLKLSALVYRFAGFNVMSYALGLFLKFRGR